MAALNEFFGMLPRAAVLPVLLTLVWTIEFGIRARVRHHVKATTRRDVRPRVRS